MIDCILVGYNEVDFKAQVAKHRPKQQRNGYYSYLKANSVLLGGERVTYMELLNRVLARARKQPTRLSVFELPNLAVCYLASYMRRRGLEVETVNFFNHDRDQFAALLDRGPRTVAITTTFYVDPAPICEIVEFARERAPDALVVVGGPHIFNTCKGMDEVTQDYVLEAMGADIYIHDSQGEATLARLLGTLREQGELWRVPNLIYARRLQEPSGRELSRPSLRMAGTLATSDRFVRTGREEENNDMNENAIDWRLLSPATFTPAAQTRTARSCAYKCAFCTFPETAGPLALADIDVVERELRCLKEQGVRYLTFIDDTFNVPLPRFKKLLRMMIANDFGFRWFSHFRPANADEETVELMAESGCMAVFLGIESGDQRILDNMNKKSNIRRYAEGIERLAKNGILSFCSFIVGFPGETEESIQNTIDFINRCAPTYYQAALYYHFDGTPIGRRREEFGIRSAAYSWKHDTMDWRAAAAGVERVIKSVTNARFLPLLGFDFFGIPYFLSQGIAIEQFNEFLDMAGRMLVASLDDSPEDVPAIDDRMVAIFGSGAAA